jgi:hypothetical protein
VRTLFGEAFEYQQTVPFFSLFMATLRADPPVGDAESLRRLGSSVDLRYWVVHDLHDAIHAAAAKTPLASIPGAEIELRLFARDGRLSGWEGELESSVVPPWDWGFEVGVAGVDELWVVAA